MNALGLNKKAKEAHSQKTGMEAIGEIYQSSADFFVDLYEHLISNNNLVKKYGQDFVKEIEWRKSQIAISNPNNRFMTDFEAIDLGRYTTTVISSIFTFSTMGMLFNDSFMNGSIIYPNVNNFKGYSYASFYCFYIDERIVMTSTRDFLDRENNIGVKTFILSTSTICDIEYIYDRMFDVKDRIKDIAAHLHKIGNPTSGCVAFYDFSDKCFYQYKHFWMSNEKPEPIHGTNHRETVEFKKNWTGKRILINVTHLDDVPHYDHSK